MAVPKRKTSKSRRDKRRTHYKLKVPAMSVCPQCGMVKAPHKACRYCGTYKGSEVITVDE